MEDCVFCRIVQGEADTKLLKETKNLVVFKDINPQAAIHVLIVPKKHIRDITEIDNKLWDEIKDVAVYFAREKGLSGFRLVHNAGDVATIPHMQVHFLSDVAPERAV